MPTVERKKAPNFNVGTLSTFETFSFIFQNVADIKKLKSSGICTIKGIQMTTKRRLNAIKGFSEAKVDKIKEACAKLCVVGFETALQVSDRRKQVFKISTGSQELE